jgi:hypothetical protein
MTRDEMIETVRDLPTYAEVRLAANGSPVLRGIVRDLGGRLPRRVTIVDTGTEFFVDSDTQLDALVLGWTEEADR